MNSFYYILYFFILALFCSCQEGLREPNDNKTIKEETGVSNSVTINEICYPNIDSLKMWENGLFLNTYKSERDYVALLEFYCSKDTLTARDIEDVYPISVEEMNFFFEEISSRCSRFSPKIHKIDSLMFLYADADSLSCLTKFLNMYFIMDPRCIDRDWMGDWNLNCVMYTVIPDNKESFMSYYDTLNRKYEWLTKEWLYSYLTF